MRELGIEFISVFGLPPVDFVHLAPLESLGYPGFSLKDDVRIRHDLLAAMADRGVSISLGEGMVIVPGADVSELADDLDIMAELGAAKINTLSFDKDRNRTFDQLATLTDMAATRGIETTIEMAPGLTIGDLSAVMAAIDHVGSPGLRVTVDTMHVLPEGSHVRADGSGRRGASACRHAAWGHGSPSALYGGSA
jgi:sugar phosphate isomerase/epimerase